MPGRLPPPLASQSLLSRLCPLGSAQVLSLDDMPQTRHSLCRPLILDCCRDQDALGDELLRQPVRRTKTHLRELDRANVIIDI
jgi:hypothetical protein